MDGAGGGLDKRSTDSAVVVLLEPDSPTMASVRPRASSKDTPSTALIGGPAPPPRYGKCTARSRTDSSGAEAAGPEYGLRPGSRSGSDHDCAST